MTQSTTAQKRFFSQENLQQFFRDVFSVAMYFLVFRIFFAFLFAFLFAQEWHVEKVWHWLPIIAFNADVATFETMNSYAVFSASVAIFGMFVYYGIHKSIRMRPRLWAWFVGVCMVFLQYSVLVFLNRYLQFGVHVNLWLPLGLLVVGASGILWMRERTWRREMEV